MKDVTRRGVGVNCEYTDLDVPNVHDGRKSNGQVRFSVKTQLLTSQRENAENLFELLRGVARACRVPIIRYWAVAAPS